MCWDNALATDPPRAIFSLAMIGDVDAAVDQLAYLLNVPSYISVSLLRVDHTWDPLRGNPRFDRLRATK